MFLLLQNLNVFIISKRTLTAIPEQIPIRRRGPAKSDATALESCGGCHIAGKYPPPTCLMTTKIDLRPGGVA